MTFEQTLKNFGVGTGQVALMVGGLLIGVILPILIPRMGTLFPYLGVAMMAAGGMWYVTDKSKAVSGYTNNKRGGYIMGHPSS